MSRDRLTQLAARLGELTGLATISIADPSNVTPAIIETIQCGTIDCVIANAETWTSAASSLPPNSWHVPVAVSLGSGSEASPWYRLLATDSSTIQASVGNDWELEPTARALAEDIGLIEAAMQRPPGAFAPAA